MRYLELAKRKAKELGLDRKEDRGGRQLTSEVKFEEMNGGPPQMEKAHSLIDPVADFREKNLAIRIRSAVLGENVWLVSNEAVREHLKSEGLVCYLAEEIPGLKGLSRETLRAIHEAKRVFPNSRLESR